LALPVPVKEEEIEAVLKDGVLTISFTKVKQDTVKKIQVLYGQRAITFIKIPLLRAVFLMSSIRSGGRTCKKTPHTQRCFYSITKLI
jgi:hypothetical protein